MTVEQVLKLQLNYNIQNRLGLYLVGKCLGEPYKSATSNSLAVLFYSNTDLDVKRVRVVDLVNNKCLSVFDATVDIMGFALELTQG